MSLLEGKNILIVGVANKYSIASGIASSMANHGANLAFTYQNERLRQKVEQLAKGWGSEICLPCDVG
jgi:enoyl-[acyl-carrier protein] reductase I